MARIGRLLCMHDNILTALLAWFDEHDIRLHPSLRIRNTAKDSAIELRASSPDILPQDLLASIPLHCILSAKTSSLHWGALQGLAPDTELAVCLLHEISLGAASRWHAYIQSLPLHVASACTWSTTSRQWLKGTEASLQVQQKQDHVQQQYPLARSLLDSRMDLSLDRFLWACTLVWSRAFRVDETYHQLALVPLADIFNHHYESDTQIESEPYVCPECGASSQCIHDGPTTPPSSPPEQKNQTTLEMRADHSLPSSDEPREVFNSYGELSNTHLLIYYGFILDANPFDTFPLSLRLAPKDEVRLRSLQSPLGRPDVSVLAHLNCDGHLSNDLFIHFFLQCKLEPDRLTACWSAYEASIAAGGTWPGALSDATWACLRALAGAISTTCDQFAARFHEPAASFEDLFALQDHATTAGESDQALGIGYAITQRLILRACKVHWTSLLVDEGIASSSH